MGNLWDAIKDALNTIWEEAKKLFKNLWDRIVYWASKATEAMEKIVRDTFNLAKDIVVQVGTFIENIGNGLYIIYKKVYYNSNGVWSQVVPNKNEKNGLIIQTIPESEVPDWAKTTTINRPLDITKRDELILSHSH